MKYLSATELQITPEERKALIKVKRFLKTLELPKDPTSRNRHTRMEAVNPKPAKFNMTLPISVYDCGTACCIGGWVKVALAGLKLTPIVAIPSSLVEEIHEYVWDQYRNLGPMKRLFFPGNGISLIQYDTITPALAIAEIIKFLTTGKAEW